MKIKGSLMILLFFIVQTGLAGNIQYTNQLTKSQIILNAIIDVRDQGYNSTATGVTYSSKVSLIYGREGLSDISTTGNWSYKVPLSVQFINNAGYIISTFSDSLKISYQSGGVSVYESTRLYNYP